jgi:hypothetical protein
MQLEQDKLKTENAKLANTYRDKNRKLQQTQELYDRLKRKEMTAATQSAAFESVDEVLQSVINRQDSNEFGQSTQYHSDHSPFRQFGPIQDLRDPVHDSLRGQSFGTAETAQMPPPMNRPSNIFGKQTHGQCKNSLRFYLLHLTSQIQ